MSKPTEHQRTAAGALTAGIAGGTCGAIAGGFSIYYIVTQKVGAAAVITQSDIPVPGIRAVQIIAGVLGAVFGAIGSGLGGAVAGSYWPSRRVLIKRAGVALGLRHRIVK